MSLSGGLSYGFSLAAFPSVELIVYSMKIDDYLPIDFGLSVRGLITRYDNSDSTSPAGWLHIGIGPVATAHISFNNLEAHSLPFMENFDFYVAVGPVYDIISYTGTYATTPPPIPSNGIGVTTAGGVKYYFTDWLAVHAELFNWTFSSGVAAGLTFNF